MAEATINAPNLSRARVEPRRFNVDLWATSINDVEIGIYRQTQHRAKSQQFTKDMDVIGQVRENGARSGVIAYRKGLWRDTSGAKRRLVVKLFSETMVWRATLDMMVGRSLQLTHGADGLPVTVYSVNAANHDQLITIERSADKWLFFPEKFSFFILTDKGPKYFKLRQNLLSIGQDYKLYDERNRRVGYLDGKLVDFGGLWKVKLDGDVATPQLESALKLFCGMLRFNKQARSHVRGLARDIRRGREEVALDHNERDLYMNPRRTR